MRSPKRWLPVLIYPVFLMLLAISYLAPAAGASEGPLVTQEGGRRLFYLLSGTQLLLLALLTPGWTAGFNGRERAVGYSSEGTSVPYMRPSAHGFSRILLYSLRFPLMLVAVSVPVLCAALLMGELQLHLLPAVYAYSLVIVLVLGVSGMYFTVRLRRRAAAVALAYTFMLVVFLGTGVMGNLLSSILQPAGSPLTGIVLGLNPMGALLSILNPDLSKEAFGNGSEMHLWYIAIPVYTALSGWMAWSGSRHWRRGAVNTRSI